MGDGTVYVEAFDEDKRVEMTHSSIPYRCHSLKTSGHSSVAQRSDSFNSRTFDQHRVRVHAPPYSLIEKQTEEQQQVWEIKQSKTDTACTKRRIETGSKDVCRGCRWTIHCRRCRGFLEGYRAEHRRWNKRIVMNEFKARAKLQKKTEKRQSFASSEQTNLATATSLKQNKRTHEYQSSNPPHPPFPHSSLPTLLPHLLPSPPHPTRHPTPHL